MTTYIPSLTLPSAVFLNPAVSVLLPVALGTAVGLGTSPNTRRTYAALKQPPLRPPPWLFGPVWTVLYGLMGYAAYRTAFNGLSPFNSPETIATARQAMTLYTVQLGLNLIWTPLFFVAKRPVEATVDIITLGAANAYLTYLYSSVDTVAAWCQAPYLGWLSFATYLCVSISHLNDWDLKGKEVKEE